MLQLESMKTSVFLRLGRRALLCGASLAGLAAVSRGDTTLSTTTFSCKSQSQAYTVPAGADYIIVKAWGAGGGCGSNTSGGDGAYVQATCDVSPGQSCTIKVGTGGTCGSGGGWPNGYSGQKSGCGGGGGDSEVDTPNCVLTACGGGGGGSSRAGYCGNTNGSNHNQCGAGQSGWDGGDGGGDGALTFSGSWRSTVTQCGGNGTPPCTSDPNYPGNNVGCAGTSNKHNDGCGGAVVVIACKRVSAQTITFPNPGSQCSNTTVALTASASSALPVTYAVTSGPATLTGASARLTATGSVTITASQAGSTSFTAATPVSVTFSVYAKPVIVSPGTASGKLNQTFSYTIVATGSPTNYGATGLPSGLSVNSATGQISGTPLVTGTFPVTVSASNAAASGSAVVTVTVTQTYNLAITGSPSYGGAFSGGGTYDPGTVVSISEVASSGYRAGGWGGTDGSKTASPTSAATTITMTGNRTLVANFVRQATLTVTAGTGGVASGSGTYDIGAVVPISATATGNYVFQSWTGSGVVSSNSAATTVVVPGNEIVTASFMQPPSFSGGTSTQILVVGHTFSLPVSATGATSFSATSLPPGLSIDSCTGHISGNPATAGSWSATITASNGGGSANETVPFTVYNTPVITGAPSVSCKLHEPYSTTVTATGNPTSFGATGLPPGLSIDPISGVISGTPTSPGSFPVTATATNPGASGSATITVHVSQTYTLTIAAAPSAGGSYSGSGTFDPGTVVTVSETANAGYRASGWGGADGSQTAAPSSATTTIVMNSNRNLAANFVPQATLTVTATVGGTATGGGVYDVGATVPIAATPASGYSFTGWTGTGVGAPGSAATSVTVAGNEIVVASFTQPPPPPVIPTYNLTITGSPGAGGTFSGAGSYPAGTVVSITEIPANGYRTNGWGGPDAGSTAVPSNASTTIVMNANRSLAAEFVQQGTLTVTAGTGGTAGGGGTYDVGTTVPISASPNLTYVFGGWSGAAADPAAMASTVTITGNLAVTASFTHVPQPPTATLNAAASAYTGSPFTVTSVAGAPDDNLTLHSIEWLSPAGAWTVDSASASGSTDNRSLGINFPSAGNWTLRAGASVDNGVTWVYSPSVQVTVVDGITTYTLQSMAVPNGNVLAWYAPSPVVQKTYQVQHLNP
jgi:Divergent InlB B-repeat domain/Putative Ig domain